MPVTGFEDSLKSLNDAEVRIIPCLYENTKALKEVLKGLKVKSAAVFIGPEGDFTEKEIATAKNAGAVPVSLGREVLRSETAAICALSILNYELRW